MNILLTAVTGLIGSEFIRQYSHEHEFTVISRIAVKAKSKLGDNVKIVESVSSIENFENFDAVINLAGEPIADKRWTDTQKKIIIDNRWDITSEQVTKINNWN